MWVGFEAAHIFCHEGSRGNECSGRKTLEGSDPRSRGSGQELCYIYTNNNGTRTTTTAGRWITIDLPQGGKINSAQNGILLNSTLHKEFDQYLFSINPNVSFLSSTLHSILTKLT